MRCSTRSYKKGQHPFYQGDAQTYVYRVQAGGLNLFLNLGNGRRQIIGFAFPGDFVGLGVHHHFVFTAQAFVRTELRCILKDELHFLARHDPRVAFKLYEATALEAERTYDLALTAGQRDSEGRLAAFFLALSRRNAQHGDDPSLINLPMLRVDIADYLGLTLETVSRTFTKFQKRGLIDVQRRHQVRLVESPKLRILADATASSA